MRRIELFLFALLFAPSIVLATPQPGDEETLPPSPSRIVEMEGISPAAAPAETDDDEALRRAMDALDQAIGSTGDMSFMSSPGGSVVSSISSAASSMIDSPTRKLDRAVRLLMRKTQTVRSKSGRSSVNTSAASTDDEEGEGTDFVGRDIGVIEEEELTSAPRTPTAIEDADQDNNRAIEEWVKKLPPDLAQLEELTKTLQEKLRVLEEQERLNRSDRSLLLSPGETPDSRGNSRDRSSPVQELVSSGPVAYMDGAVDEGDGDLGGQAKEKSGDQSSPGQELVSSGSVKPTDEEVDEVDRDLGGQAKEKTLHSTEVRRLEEQHEDGDGYPPNGDGEGYDAALLNKKQSINGEEEGTKKCCCSVM